MATILNHVEVGDVVHVFVGPDERTTHTRAAVVLDVAQPHFTYQFIGEEDEHVGTANSIARLG